MTDLKNLPEISEQLLHNLKADDKLKQRILVSAVNTDPSGSSFKEKGRRPLLALLALSLLLVVSLIGIRYLKPAQNQDDAPVSMQVIPAGSHRDFSPVHLQIVINQIVEKNAQPEESPSPEPEPEQTDSESEL